MDWIVTTARTVDEAQTRALDLLGVDLDDAEIQVIEEGKTGLFGRTKSEARVRARIKPKAPPVKDERRQGRGEGRSRGKGGGGRGGNGGGGGRNRGGDNRGGRGGNQAKSGQKGGQNRGGQQGGQGKGNGRKSEDRRPSRDGDGARQDTPAMAGAGAGGGTGGGRKRRRGGGGAGGGRGDGGQPRGEDRVEMPVEEQRETLEAFVAGVATVFDSNAKVELVEDDTTLLAQVTGEDLGRLIGNKASTLQTLEELARTAMHRAAAGRRYHRIQVDVDNYRARRREALARFATELAESVVDSGVSKAMEPMGAADRKVVHDAVGQVSGVETVSEGRDPRRYIVIMPLGGGSDEEE